MDITTRIFWTIAAVCAVLGAQRKLGVRCGGIAAALPLISLPAITVTTLALGTDHGMQAAMGGILACAASALCLIAYIHCAKRLSALASTGIALLVFVLTLLAVRAVQDGVFVHLLIALGILTLTLASLRRLTRCTSATAATELPASGMFALVLLGTALSGWLAQAHPLLGGAVAAAPTLTLSALSMQHHRHGSGIVVQIAAGSAQGLLLKTLVFLAFSAALTLSHSVYLALTAALFTGALVGLFMSNMIPRIKVIATR
jgi:hypothetical protein